MGVNLLGHLEGVRVGQVHVGRGDGKDEAAFPADELQDHVLDLVLNVWGLVPHGHLGDAWEVDEGQVQHWEGNQREGHQSLGRGGTHSHCSHSAHFPKGQGVRPQHSSCSNNWITTFDPVTSLLGSYPTDTLYPLYFSDGFK